MSDPSVTTDPQDELFDVLDEYGAPTGEVKARGDVHRDGDWHGALHIWVGGVDEAGREFALFQRRSHSKDTWPGALDVAVGGHLRAGESLAETVREADEEIGLRVTPDELTRLGRRFTARPGATDNEVQQVYALRSDLPLERYRLHPEEIDAVISIPLAEALALFEGRLGVSRGLELARGAATAIAIPVVVADFAAGEIGGYAVLALHGLRHVLRGRPPALFELR